MKDSYIMHCDYDSHFELLTDAELGRLIRDVNSYVKSGILPQYSKKERVLNMAFSFMKTNIDIETEKYLKKCEKNKENGQKGGRPRNPKKPNGFDEKPEEPKKADTDTNTDTDTTTDTDYSVCSASAREEFKCHLDCKQKTINCVNCMKKHQCPLEEEPLFKSLYGMSFYEYVAEKEQKQKEIAETLETMKTNVELIDCDWLNGNYEEE